VPAAEAAASLAAELLGLEATGAAYHDRVLAVVSLAGTLVSALLAVDTGALDCNTVFRLASNSSMALHKSASCIFANPGSFGTATAYVLDQTVLGYCGLVRLWLKSRSSPFGRALGGALGASLSQWAGQCSAVNFLITTSAVLSPEGVMNAYTAAGIGEKTLHYRLKLSPAFKVALCSRRGTSSSAYLLRVDSRASLCTQCFAWSVNSFSLS
jgi:hypothetical protein